MKRTRIKGVLNGVAALTAGAAAMYLLDPRMGRRRRALVRDKMLASRRDVVRYGRGQAKRAADHLRGAIEHAKSISCRRQA